MTIEPIQTAQPVQPQTKVQYDKEDQLKRVQAYVLQGETLIAVFDCRGVGTGFVGFTDQRLIFYDQAFLTKRKAMISIPYHQIIGVASIDEGLIFTTSEITLLTAAGNYHFQFRGADKAHMAYRYIMKQILGQVHLSCLANATIDDHYVDQLRGQHATITEILQAQRAAISQGAAPGLHITAEIYIHILEDALTTINSIIQYLDIDNHKNA